MLVRWLIAGWLLLGTALPLLGQGEVSASLLAPQSDSAAAAKARQTASLRAADAAVGAVVYVAVEVDGPRGKFLLERSGTGVVVGDGSLVLTWTRLIADAKDAADKRIYVQWPDDARTKVDATLAKSDAASGLTLLRLSQRDPGARPLPVANVALAAGLPMTVVGCPEGTVAVAFEGVLSDLQAPPEGELKGLAADDVKLTDARPDHRCDGAAAIDEQGRLVGLCATTAVQRDVTEPTLEDLRRPSFLLVLGGGAIARAFASELAPQVSNAPSARESGIGPVAAGAMSVVGVYGGKGAWPAADARDPGATLRLPALGSGVVLSATGLVVTNNHLVPEEAAQLRLADGKSVRAKVVARKESLNMALLQVEGAMGVLQAARLRTGEMLVGERLFAIGRPRGTNLAVSAGVLSALRNGGRLQADPDLGNPNAGGAVVDRQGLLVGIADGGAMDPLEMAFAMRGDRVTKETNLSTCLSLERVRLAFADQLAAAGALTEVAFQPSAAASEVTQMVEQVAGGLLNIYVGSTRAGSEDDNPFASVVASETQVFGLGSGVIIDQSGLALSNWHVVDEAVFPDGRTKPGFAVEASVFGGRKYSVQVLAISREDDLSLLQLQLEPGETVKAIALGNSTALRIGERVAAIGNPHGKANTITAGIVTAKEQGIRVRGRWAKLEHLIETDAAINGGNSGGALLDMAGRLVGINSAGGGTFTNRGYAISVDHVRRQVLGLLLQAYKLRSPDLGLAVTDAEGKVVVSLVDARGPAAAAGVQTGDQVLSLAGTSITWSPGFARTLLSVAADAPVALVTERKGERREVALTPVAAAVWALLRQTGLQCRDLPFEQAPDALRAASVAMHRKFTGDTSGEPSEIQANAVRIDKVHSGIQKGGIDLREGDLLVAVLLKDALTGGEVLAPVADVVGLKNLFNDRELGSYDGQEFRCWVARGGALVEVDIMAKRLFW